MANEDMRELYNCRTAPSTGVFPIPSTVVYVRAMGLGANVRRLREGRGWTLDKLSEISGVEVGTISALEVRDSQRSKYVHKLANALEVTVDELQGDTAPPSPGGHKAAALSRDKSALIEAFDGLLQEQQEAVLADLQLKAAENRRNYEAMKKKFGITGTVPDDQVAKHIEPRPPQREIPLEPPLKPRRRKAKRR